MKMTKQILIGVMIAVLLFALAGCGGSDSSGAKDAGGEPAVAADAVPETVEQNAASMVTDAADTQMTADEFVGNWINMDDAALFVNIAKEGDKYTYEDNDGSYEAAFADGILKVTVAENDFADVYIDKDSGNLVMVYHDSTLTYYKK